MLIVMQSICGLRLWLAVYRWHTSMDDVTMEWEILQDENVRWSKVSECLSAGNRNNTKTEANIRNRRHSLYNWIHLVLYVCVCVQKHSGHKQETFFSSVAYCFYGFDWPFTVPVYQKHSGDEQGEPKKAQDFYALQATTLTIPHSSRVERQKHSI